MLPISSLCSPDTAIFIIGPSRKEYRLPKALIDSLANDDILQAMFDSHDNPDVDIGDTPPMNWSYHIDQDIFNLVVKYAYTGDYKVPKPSMAEDDVIKRQQEYSEARKQNPQAYWVYESSPYVQDPMPSSVFRCHAQVWNFAKCSHIRGLEAVSQKQLRKALTDYIGFSRTDNYFDLEEDMFNQVVDVIGYVYHQGFRYWGLDTIIKPETALLHPMRLMVAWFARKYLCNRGETHVRGQYAWDIYNKNLKTWAELLKHVPLIAIDMVLCDPERVPWVPWVEAPAEED
ncbi:hypothetical protein QBC32DRAFT_267282 [Pseudoneurospora amorphoporcata]|uniref:BTB domain-containing protein n=1 Tax=Pseudoneurospora amorphoporcata TaxID=241081 RepID=A0AAN6NNM3_9PEZI|nr:hypothetical protein QBC32DRAFT_267282 [Pseudoneurospora amorphoporcata]